MVIFSSCAYVFKFVPSVVYLHNTDGITVWVIYSRDFHLEFAVPFCLISASSNSVGFRFVIFIYVLTQRRGWPRASKSSSVIMMSIVLAKVLEGIKFPEELTSVILGANVMHVMTGAGMLATLPTKNNGGNQSNMNSIKPFLRNAHAVLRRPWWPTPCLERYYKFQRLPRGLFGNCKRLPRRKSVRRRRVLALPRLVDFYLARHHGHGMLAGCPRWSPAHTFVCIKHGCAGFSSTKSVV